eukprot:TCONS_00071974-protein
MNSISSKYIHEIKVLGLEKLRKDFSGKRYEFVLNVKWSNGTDAKIYRPHSMFFDFQGVLAEMFKDVKIPSAPVVRFHWALLGKLGHEKECKVMEEFCQKIIRLPPNVSKASIVLHFFETWGTDVRSKEKKQSEFFDTEVGRASIQSTQERKAGMSDKDDQYRVLASYEATNIGETSLIEGTFVTIVEKNERGWWFVAHDNGGQGWAPATYLEPIIPSGNNDEGYDWISVTDSNGVGEKYVSMVGYTAQNSDELSYGAGQEIEALMKSSYGWWKVRINGQVGITPATNLQKVDDTTLYQSADELKSRTVSISSSSGLYAVIRKPPPRRESLRSRSSSGQSNLQSPPLDSTAITNNNGSLTGKKPSRFVYSATSFAGGKFVIGDEDKENGGTLPHIDIAKTPTEEDQQISHAVENYENVDANTLTNNKLIRPVKSIRSQSVAPETIPIDKKVIALSNYMNYRRSLDGSDAHFFVALMDYDPGQHRKDDIRLTKGDLVQLISSDSGWLFVLLLKDDFDKQGWVPDTYLERKLDIDVGSIAAHTERGGSPKPKPRPRPAPRPRTKPQETPQTNLPKRPAPPKPDERDALPPSPPPVPAQQPYEEDLYDEPEMTLRSVYDAEPWYFGNISRADCERQLSTYGRQQEFLIRDSQRAKGSYALSVKYCYRIRHFPIEAVDGGKLLIGKLSFNNLMDIVIYYQKNPLFYSEHKEPISLGSAFVKDRTGQKK